MTIRDDDPLSVFRGVFARVIGWALVDLATTLFGLWAGISYKEGAVASSQAALDALVVSTFAWLLHPQIAIGIAVSGLAFYLCLQFETLKSRGAILAVTLVTWFCIAVWVL
jgi:hypothetical protein